MIACVFVCVALYIGHAKIANADWLSLNATAALKIAYVSSVTYGYLIFLLGILSMALVCFFHYNWPVFNVSTNCEMTATKKKMADRK